jgi:glycosyltransferase involved in cell wall biosynthesis
MRVAVDVSPLSHPPTGIGNYIRGSLAGMVAAAGPGDELVPFAPTSLQGPKLIRGRLAGLALRPRLLPLPASHAVRTAWSIAGFPPAEWLVGRVDALLFTDWMTPPQRRGLRATTIHDLVPHHHPEWCTPRTIAMHRRKDAAALRCDVVFTNSAYTAGDAAETLGLSPDHLVVAHPGLEPRHRPDGPRATVADRYVLGVGTLEPRKNLGRLVEAWRLLGDDRPTLVIAGGGGWGERPDLDDPRIVLPGYVPTDDLPPLYRGAEVFVYPSLFEGFGMPVIEAMACGTPVVASSHPSLDEACGDAAVRVDPGSPEGIAAGIEEAIARRDELVPRGLAHARAFTWEATGRTMMDALRERLP